MASSVGHPAPRMGRGMPGPTLGTAVPSEQEGTSQALGLARSGKTLMEIQPAAPGALSPSSCHQVELGPGARETLAGVPPPPLCPPLQGLCLLQWESPRPSQRCLVLPARGSRSHPPQWGRGLFRSLSYILTNDLKILEGIGLFSQATG